MNTRNFQIRSSFLGWLIPVCLLLAPASFARCPSGASELLPNLRALPPTGIAMLDADNMKFNSTSWNAGDGIFELVARNPDPVNLTQQVDQRIYCSDGSYYDTPAGSAEYHPTHNHVHFNDYAKYILEEDTGNPQNPRKGEKTSFCIMDTTSVNTQLIGASPSAVFAWCPTQDPDFRTQGMSVGWGDTYGSNLPGQSIYIGDLPAGTYRLRHIFDPKSHIIEIAEDDNESCKRIEIGDGPNGRYVADLGLCAPPPAAQITGIFPDSASHNSCVSVIITGDNLVPEMWTAFTGGTGPIPSASGVTFDPFGDSIEATVCVPRAKGGKKPRLGKDPVWDVFSINPALSDVGSATFPDAFTVTP